MAQYTDARLDRMGRRFPNLAPELLSAHRFIPSDTHSALAKLRLILERVAKASFTQFVQRPIPEDASLGSLLLDEDYQNALPANILAALHAVRMVANRAIHDERVSESETADSISRMLDILEWCSTWWEGSPAPSELPRGYERHSFQQYQPRDPAPSPPPTALMIGIGVVVCVVALVWLYIRVLLPGFMGEQQRNWLQRKHQEASAAGDAVVLGHPASRQTAGDAYVRGYPSSWPQPFFEEEIRPGAWGRWVDEPPSRSDGSTQEQDFIWYWSAGVGGIREPGEWSIQCENREGIVRDVPAGHNEECEGARRMKIRNDWSRPAFVYYFKKHG